MRKNLLLLSFSMLLALPSVAYDFKYKYEGQTITYTVIDEEAKTVEIRNLGQKVSGDVALPSNPMDGDVEYTLTVIGESAFSGCSSLTSVIIPNSVTKIGRDAFKGCSGLKKSAYPNTIEYPFDWNGVCVAYDPDGAIIEDGWIYGPDKAEIRFAPYDLVGKYIVPEYVISIGDSAFEGCSGLTSVVIPNSVTEIGNYAFQGCSGLTSVIIPNSVTKIGSSAFEGCSGLKKSAYPNTLGNPFGDGICFAYDPDGAIIEDGWIYGSDKAEIIFAPYDLEGEYVVPEYVTSIGSGAFEGCSGLTSITTLSTTPATMHNDSFEGLYDDTALCVPQAAAPKYLTTNWALFKNLRLEGTEQELAIYNDGVLNYRLIPATNNDDRNLAVIISGDYSGEIAIPERFTDDSDAINPIRYYIEGIGYKAFSSSSVSRIDFNSRIDLKYIGSDAFYNCMNLSEISIPATVETIGDYAFYGTIDLKIVDFKEGLKSIGAYAFASRYDRSSNSNPIAIPSSVSSIGTDAFYGFTCSEVQINDLEAWCRIDFGSLSANPLYHSRKLVLNGEPLSSLVIPESIIAVKPYTFSNIDDLTSVILNDAVEAIGEKAFYGCRNLETLTIPASVATIGTEAVPATSINLVDATAPVELAKNAFYNDITNMYWGRPISQDWGVKTSKLDSLVIGNTLVEIPVGCFNSCSSLKSLKLGGSLKTIGDEAFKGCTQLEEVIVPPSVETIGASAFAGNRKLASIIMGHSVATIGEKAFDGCPATTVSITAQTPPTAPNNTFSSYSGKLYLQGEAAVDAYYDAYTCWDRFNGYVMIEATGIEADTKPISGNAGDTFQLTATLMPENVTLPHIFWRSTNPEIATVDENGLVTLHANLSDVMTLADEGNCKIIAESLYADGPVVEVTVFNSAFNDVEEIFEEMAGSEIDYNAPMEVYNLSGMKVADTTSGLAKGFYIVRQGKIVKKIAVKY